MANRLLFTVPNPLPVIRLAGRISLSASYECQGVTGERTGPRENGVRATFAASSIGWGKRKRKGRARNYSGWKVDGSSSMDRGIRIPRNGSERFNRGGVTIGPRADVIAHDKLIFEWDKRQAAKSLHGVIRLWHSPLIRLPPSLTLFSRLVNRARGVGSFAELNN